jgi:hypothetical protein
MSSDRISSTGLTNLQSEAYEINRQVGNSTTLVYSGSRQRMLAQRNIEYANGANVIKLESEGDGNYRLTATYSKDISGNEEEQPVSVHELENTIEQVDVYNSDVLRSQLLTAFTTWSASNAALAFLKGEVDKWDAVENKNAAAITTIEADFSAAYSGTNLTLMLNLFRGIAYHQIKQAPQFNSVYRRRITAANFNQIKAAFTGVKKIWTTSEVVDFETVPALWWFTLPTETLWFKCVPSVNSVAGQKTEIVYSYLGCAYAWSGIHTAYGSAVLQSF